MIHLCESCTLCNIDPGDNFIIPENLFVINKTIYLLQLHVYSRTCNVNKRLGRGTYSSINLHMQIDKFIAKKKNDCEVIHNN